MERELGQHRLLAGKQANGKAAPDPKDTGGECAIYLGKQMSKHYLQHGSPCPRLVWVQLRVSQIHPDLRLHRRIRMVIAHHT